MNKTELIHEAIRCDQIVAYTVGTVQEQIEANHRAYACRIASNVLAGKIDRIQETR